jgi:hypothetical protein
MRFFRLEKHKSHTEKAPQIQGARQINTVLRRHFRYREVCRHIERKVKVEKAQQIHREDSSRRSSADTGCTVLGGDSIVLKGAKI